MTRQSYIPIHDGAIKYFDEIGMWSEADAKRQEYNVWLSDWYVEAYAEAMTKAKAEKIAINPTNAAWIDFWIDYKNEIGIPKFKIMNDDEITEALKTIN